MNSFKEFIHALPICDIIKDTKASKICVMEIKCLIIKVRYAL